eukprot:COSAG04_NODE_1701_length_5891_cov_2.394337_4_plen_326_part_00
MLPLQAHIKALANGESRPFPDVVLCNIGNPQSVGQQPLTFPRQVRAPRGTVFTRSCLKSPPLALHRRCSRCARAPPCWTTRRSSTRCPPTSSPAPSAFSTAPTASVRAAEPLSRPDTRRRSLARSRCCPGAYSDSKGIESARESVKAYIEERDGHPTDIESLYLTNGASEGVKTLLNMLISGPNDGVMIPIPQYPLYSATITALGGAQIGYYLDEGNDWAMTTANLDEVAAQARADGITPRALCIINPVRTECSWLGCLPEGGWSDVGWYARAGQPDRPGHVRAEHCRSHRLVRPPSTPAVLFVSATLTETMDVWWRAGLRRTAC